MSDDPVRSRKLGELILPVETDMRVSALLGAYATRFRDLAEGIADGLEDLSRGFGESAVRRAGVLTRHDLVGMVREHLDREPSNSDEDMARLLAMVVEAGGGPLVVALELLEGHVRGSPGGIEVPAAPAHAPAEAAAVPDGGPGELVTEQAADPGPVGSASIDWPRLNDGDTAYAPYGKNDRRRRSVQKKNSKEANEVVGQAYAAVLAGEAVNPHGGWRKDVWAIAHAYAAERLGSGVRVERATTDSVNKAPRDVDGPPEAVGSDERQSGHPPDEPAAPAQVLQMPQASGAEEPRAEEPVPEFEEPTQGGGEISSYSAGASSSPVPPPAPLPEDMSFPGDEVEESYPPERLDGASRFDEVPAAASADEFSASLGVDWEPGYEGPDEGGRDDGDEFDGGMSPDEALIAQNELEAAERDLDDSEAIPIVPPAPRPVAREKEPGAALPPRVGRAPPERLTMKAQPVAIPGRPTGFVTPDRPVSLTPDPNGVFRSTVRPRLP